MTKILLIVLVVILGAFGISHLSSQPPLRGLVRAPGSSQAVLLARARPLVTFELDPALRLGAAGWCSIQPESPYMTNRGEAKAWLALYGYNQSLVVTAVCDAENNWEWLAAHHEAFKSVRRMEFPLGDRTLFESLYVLERKHDPFCGQGEGYCLVYRAKVLLEFEKCQVLAEYHEDLPAEQVRDIAFATDTLNAFQTRARAMVKIARPDTKPTQEVVDRMEKMGTLDKAISRRALARWTGNMHHRGEL